MTDIRSLENDLKFGMKKEEEVLPLIKHNWKDEVNILNTKIRFNNEYHKYDFESDGGSIWEVKSRRNRKTTYPTTIIPYHKSMETERPYYFVFNFTDACCYIEYDEEKFASFKTRMITVYRQGSRPIPVLHFEIPIELLTDMKPLNDC
jgi:hypothetical protein